MLRPKNSGKKPDAADYTISYPFPIIANEKLYFVCEEYHWAQLTYICMMIKI